MQASKEDYDIKPKMNYMYWGGFAEALQVVDPYLSDVIIRYDSIIHSYVSGDLTSLGNLSLSLIKKADTWIEANYYDKDLLPLVSDVYRYGMQKYARNNYLTGSKASVWLDAIGRHILAVFKGEDTAPDSKLPHMAHIAANVLILLDCQRAGSLENDLLEGEVKK